MSKPLDLSHQRLQEVGLDITAFEQCLSSGCHRDAVQQDIAEGRLLGITGTPTCFIINGRLVSGAQSLESFTRVIEDELTRAR